MSLTLSLSNAHGVLTLSWVSTVDSIQELHLLLANVTDQAPISKVEIPNVATKSYTIDSQSLLSGKSYVMSLQATDSDGNVITSNIVNVKTCVDTNKIDLAEIILYPIDQHPCALIIAQGIDQNAIRIRCVNKQRI